MRRCAALAFICTIALSAGDPDDLRATQAKLVAARDDDKAPRRDDFPLKEVRRAKGLLLRLAQARLQVAGRDAEPEVLTKAMETELDASIKGSPPDGLDRLGDLGAEFSRPEGESAWMQVRTSVGVPCGSDESVYLYEWQVDRWSRRFTLENDAEEIAKYGPQQSLDVEVSAVDAHGARLLLVTGWPPACMSVWHTYYVKLFRIEESQTLLLEETPTANIGADSSAHLERSGVRIEFSGFSIDTFRLIRQYVLHYAVDDGKIRRIDPVGLSPRDFVEEWLTRPWAEMSAWSDPQLAGWYQKLHKDYVHGEYNSVRKCQSDNEWQVAIDFDDKTAYFGVLDRGQDRYRMLRVSESPWPLCTGRNELDQNDH